MSFDGPMQLALLAIERGCSDAERATAPLIEDWHVLGFGDIHCCLTGQVSGHPRDVNGWTNTSKLLFLDTAAGIARTRSRWYRLGAPLDLDGRSFVDFLVKRCVAPDASNPEWEAATIRNGFHLRGLHGIDMAEAKMRMEHDLRAARRLRGISERLGFSSRLE